MIYLITLILLLTNSYQTKDDNQLIEIERRDGKVMQFEEIGRSEKSDGKMIKTLPAIIKGCFFHLHFNKVSEITFGMPKDTTITANVKWMSSKQTKLDIVKNKLICKIGDETVVLPLEAVRKIKFVRE
jgi:hypothetical protein